MKCPNKCKDIRGGTLDLKTGKIKAVRGARLVRVFCLKCGYKGWVNEKVIKGDG